MFLRLFALSVTNPRERVEGAVPGHVLADAPAGGEHRGQRAAPDGRALIAGRVQPFLAATER